ncbi:MAG: hypothetical protein ACK4UN_18115 [Limisphaerales bacterium]
MNVSGELHPHTRISQLLTGLVARLEIADQQGSNVLELVDVKSVPKDWVPQEPLPLFHFTPMRKGTYVAKLTVLEGAPALEGLPQRIESTYLLCGLEELPAVIGKGLGFLSTALGSVIGGLALLFVFQARNKREH